ncbi:MAG: hypothetical protein N3F08_04725 [Crenarchaeota archaeon]|nr:hypothetical protein [Thermoproteota archaeon]
MMERDGKTALVEYTEVTIPPKLEENEEKLLRILEAELKEIRRRKELAIGYDAYAFLCEKEKKLEEEILGLRIRRAIRRQMQAKLLWEKEERENKKTLILANP